MRQGESWDVRSLFGDTFTYGEARQAGLGDSRIYRLRDQPPGACKSARKAIIVGQARESA